jgi:hypothetical protein
MIKAVIDSVNSPKLASRKAKMPTARTVASAASAYGPGSKAAAISVASTAPKAVPM